MFVQNPLVHSSAVFRQEWGERVKWYQYHGWAADYDLWVRSYLAGAAFGKIDEILLEWRDHPQRLTRTDRAYSPSNNLSLNAHYRDMIQ
jgi:hypothetical protein